MSRETKRALLISVISSLLVGAFSGAIAGAYGQEVIVPRVMQFIGVSAKAVLPTAPQESSPEPASALAPPAASVAEDSVPRAVDRVAPSVVSVLLSRQVTYRSVSASPFDDFLEQFGFPAPRRQVVPGENAERTEKRQIGGGTGFIVSSDGLVLTNRHVVADTGAEITVVLSDGRRFPATVLGRDTVVDLAVLKIDARNLSVAPLGDSDRLRVGETVIAIGNTLSEFPNTVTKGIVSGLARRVVAGDNRGASEVIEEAIQTDAAINPGNSGGPLINARGEVIGVNVAVSKAASGVGFAIPVNTAKRIIGSVKATGRIVRPWLGVRYIIVNAAVAERNNFSVDYGAYVTRGATPDEPAVVPGSPADRGGVKENDIIMAVGGTNVTLEHPLSSLIANYKPGDRVVIQILRAGATHDLTVMLEEFKEAVP